jgi:hypothetical protein
MKPRSFLIRSCLLAILIAGTVIALWPFFREIRHEHQVKAMLLEVQRALQEYHVAEELYPKDFPLTGAQLIQLLIETGHLENPPRNPWTGHPYRLDGAEEDHLTYRSDQLAETYELQALDPATGEPWMTLDSTEHQSLE